MQPICADRTPTLGRSGALAAMRPCDKCVGVTAYQASFELLEPVGKLFWGLELQQRFGQILQLVHGQPLNAYLLLGLDSAQPAA